MAKRIAIVGAGITGLTAADALQGAGHEIVVFESSGRCGGAIRTVHSDGWLVEAGPNTLMLRDSSLDPLLARTGLAQRMQLANPAAAKRFIVRGGRLHPLPDGIWGAIATPIFRLPGKLRVLAEPFIARNRTNPNETLAEFALRRVGREFLDYAVNPFIGGVYACAPEDLCVRHALPRLWRLEQNHGSLVRGSIALMRQRRKSGTRGGSRLVSFTGGLETLPTTLAAGIGPALQLNREVMAVERVSNKWRLVLRDGMRTQDFNSVLFSCGPSSLGHLQLGGLRPLEALATQPWSAVSSIALGFRREAIAHPLDGFGMLVPAKEGRRILGTLFSSTLFAERAPAGHVLLTVFVGGRQPEYAALADSDLEKLVLEELRELVGLGGQPVFRSRHHWPRAIPKYGREFGALAASMDNFEHEYPGLHLAGNYRTGISLGDCISAGLAAAAKIGGQP